MLCELTKTAAGTVMVEKQKTAPLTRARVF
jgi:hypothetical protein